MSKARDLSTLVVIRRLLVTTWEGQGTLFIFGCPQRQITWHKRILSKPDGLLLHQEHYCDYGKCETGE
ncbi:MAG: hypothetical protein KGI30_01140 [Planctomycetota bacterium]|nr:hypothetical protein [Planctomycetota bacterium]